MEANEPLAKEKAKTPMIMIIEANIRAEVFVVATSPYPTVVIVWIVQ